MQPDVDLGRRRFLKTSGRAALAATARSLAPSTLAAWDWSRAAAEEAGDVDHTIRIAPVSLEIGPKTVIQTTAYNGSVPGQPLRLKEGRPARSRWSTTPAIPT